MKSRSFSPSALIGRSRRFLLRNTVEGTKAPDQFRAVDPDDAAIGEFALQNV
jgi:hypothetical protein